MRVKTEQYKYVGVEKAKKTPAYWSVTRILFQEQEGKVSRAGAEYKGKNNKASTCSMRFIKEPLGDKAEEHAHSIKQGAWLELDFNDLEYKRNIFKALRKGKISDHQMATAFLLFDARHLFNAQGFHSIRKFAFNDSAGPYQIDEISYINQENKTNFEQELQKIASSDNCYFSIDLSRKFAVAFLFDGLHNPEFFNRYPQFLHLLTAYIKSLPIDNQQQLELLEQIANLNNPFLRKKEIVSNLIRIILRNESSLANYLEQRYQPKHQHSAQRNGSLFLIDLMITGEQIPFIVLSPNFNAHQKRRSPLFSMILPTMPALIALMKAVHGKEVTLPYYTVGKVSPSFIRYADEEPELFGSKIALRPVELDHPDIEANVTPHETLTTSFPKEWHDLFHTWRNANPLKPFMRYLRQVLTREKGFDMSKSIWPLSDMDFSAGRLHREALLTNPDASISQTDFYAIFLRLPSEFWGRLENYDDNLILIADMIIHREHWKGLMGAYPEKILAKIPFGRFPHVFYKMRNLIDADEKKDTRASHMYYVLAYRLSGQRHGLELCNLLDKLSLETLFYWNRNSGLYLNKTLSDLPIRAIERLNAKILYAELIRIVDRLELDESLAAELDTLHAREKMSGWQLFRQNHPVLDELIYHGASIVQATALAYLSSWLFSTNEEEPALPNFKM